MKKLPLLVTTILSLTACSSSFLQKTVTLTNDNYLTLCTPLVLSNNQELLVTLPSSRITGYKWQLEHDGSPNLALQKTKTQRDETPENRLHREETLWKFKAVKSGTTTLSFIYQLDWDTNIADAQRVQCKIQVQENN